MIFNPSHRQALHAGRGCHLGADVRLQEHHDVLRFALGQFDVYDFTFNASQASSIDFWALSSAGSASRISSQASNWSL
jgi:hypothetical protein